MHGNLKKQRGASLLIAVIFMLLLAMLGMIGMQTSRLQLRMANNVEVKANAEQAAQALIDAVAANPAMTPIIGGVGYTLCTPGGPDCDSESLYMPAGDLVAEVDDGHLSGNAVVTSPPNSPPPRGMGFSADKFSGSSFRVTSDFDRADDGLGRATITQGLVVVTPVL